MMVRSRPVTSPADAFERRAPAADALADQAGAVADACLAIARRLHGGGTLLVAGLGAAGTDAAHIGVEFTHPVIVGKRALPALSLANDAASLTAAARASGVSQVFAHQVRVLAGSRDVVLGIATEDPDASIAQALSAGRHAGALTVALLGAPAGHLAAASFVDHAIVVPSDDPLIVKEVHVSAYHILWELVHVFLEQPAFFDPRMAR